MSRIGLTDWDLKKLTALHDRLLSFMGKRNNLEYTKIKMELHELTAKIHMINDCFVNSIRGYDHDSKSDKG